MLSIDQGPGFCEEVQVTRVFVRLIFSNDTTLGPGKIQLLELIQKKGSISAAGREMRMSYRRAWDLVNSLNRTFKAPLVETQPGGRQGGGATLTSTGLKVVDHYHAIVAGVARTSKRQAIQLETLLAKRRR